MDYFVKIDTCVSHYKINLLSTYLHIIWRRLIAGPLEGLRHIAKDLHRRQQVTSIEVPPLCEVQQVLRDLGHPIPRQHPLALSKVPLNLQKQEKTELGASVSSAGLRDNTLRYTFGVNGVKKIRMKDYSLRPFLWHLYLSQAEMYSASRLFWNEPIWIKELTGAEDTHLGRNCRAKWHFTSLYRVYVHKYTFKGAALYVLPQHFWIILFLTVIEGYKNYLF